MKAEPVVRQLVTDEHGDTVEINIWRPAATNADKPHCCGIRSPAPIPENASSLRHDDPHRNMSSI
jgi:hypothetical protein